MNLFKKTQDLLVHSFNSKTNDESVLKQSSTWASAITWSLVTTTSMAVGWLAFAKTEEIVVAPGKLVPIGSVQDIQMPLGGIVSEILVEDGDAVEINQTLIKLDTEASSQKLKSIMENIGLKKKQLALKEKEFTTYQKLNEETIRALNEKIVYEKEILEKYWQLSSVGASAQLQYLQQRNTVKDVEAKLRETRLDGMRLRAIIEQDIQRLKTELSSLRSEQAETQMTLRYQVIKSPVNGIVFDLQPKGRGFTGQTTETLMKIVPLNTLEAKVEIPSSDIGFVKNNMKVDISIDSFPATDFGVLHGRVKKLGSDALPPEPAKQKNEYRFPATISLNNQELEINNGNKLKLQPGMSLTANIKLRKVSYLQLLLGSFKDKTNSLREI